MPSLGGLFGAISGAAEQVLIEFRAETGDVEKKLSALDAKLAQAEARQKAAFDAAQAQNAKAIAAEKEYAAIEQQISAIRGELAQKRVASSQLEFDAMAKVRTGLQANLAALSEQRTALALTVEAEQKHAIALQATAAAYAKKTAAARESAAASGGGAGGSALGGALGVAGGLVAFNAIMALDRALKDNIASWAEWGHAVEHASRLMGTSTENASKLLYVFQFFGLSVADADRTIAQLTRHIADNGKQFEALGIQTRKANGELVSSYDVFNQLREAMSRGGDGATKLAVQLQLMARGGSAAGQALAETNMILGLSNDQWQALGDQAERAGVVMDTKTARAAFDVYMQMRALTAEQRALGLGLSRELMPVLNGLQRFALGAMVALQGLGDAIKTLFTTGDIGATWDKLAALWTDTSRVDQLMQTAKDVLSMEDALQNNSGALKSNLDAGNAAATEAIRDQIKAVEDLARAQEEQSRVGLLGYEREAEGRIRAVEEAQRVADDAHRRETEGIQAEQRAADDTFRDAQEGRQQQIADLRTAIQLREQSLQQEEAAFQLTQDQRALRTTEQTQVGRTKGETLEAYNQRVYDHQRKLLEEQHRVTVAQKRLELDQFKANTDAQIRQIEAAGKAEQKVYEDRRRANEDRVRAIQDQQRTETERSQKAIRGIRDEMQAERDRVDKAIKGLQDVTRTQVEELNKQIENIRAAGARVPEWPTPWRNWGSPPAYTPNTQSPDARSRNAGAAPAAGTLPQEGDTQDIVGMGRAVFRGGEWHFDTIRPDTGGGSDVRFPFLDTIGNFLGGLGGSAHAYGGTLMLREPATLRGASGKNYGTFGESGTEPVTVSAGGGGGAQTIRIPVILDGRVLTEVVVEDLAREIMRRAAFGYSRKV